MTRGLAALSVLALIAAGCGGGGTSASDAAQLLPANTVAYVSLDTSAGSGQIANANAILHEFQFTPAVNRELKQVFARAAVLGPVTDVAVLRVKARAEVVALTQPKDEKALVAKLDAAKPKEAHRQVDGWTAFSSTSAALADVGMRGARLPGDPTYTKAIGTLPGSGHALIRAYASSAGALRALTGPMLQKLVPSAASTLPAVPRGWVGLALSADKGAFKLEVHTKTVGAKSTGRSLAGQLPSGSILAASFGGNGRSSTVPKAVTGDLQALSKRIGTNIAPLLKVLGGPMILYVRPGTPVPDVTIAAKPAQPKRALASVSKLLSGLTGGVVKPVPVPVPDGTLDRVFLGVISLYYGRLGDGEVVVSDSPDAIAELKGADGRLAGDAMFKDAASEAGLPDTNSGFLFVDAKDLLPVIESFAQLANAKIPASVEANFKPLESLLVYGASGGGVETFVALLKTS